MSILLKDSADILPLSSLDPHPLQGSELSSVHTIAQDFLLKSVWQVWEN